MLNKTYSLNHIVYLVGLHIYYKMIHGPYNVKTEDDYTDEKFSVHWNVWKNMKSLAGLLKENKIRGRSWYSRYDNIAVDPKRNSV